MQLLKQPNSNCLLYSAAMVLGISPAALIAEIGHDGQEVWWPELPHPRCLRGIHIEEIQDVFYSQKQCLFPIHPMPCSSPFDNGDNARAIYSAEECKRRMMSYLQVNDAILITENHACAWDSWTEKVFDPNGYIKNLEDYQIREIWLAVCLE